MEEVKQSIKSLLYKLEKYSRRQAGGAEGAERYAGKVEYYRRKVDDYTQKLRDLGFSDEDIQNEYARQSGGLWWPLKIVWHSNGNYEKELKKLKDMYRYLSHTEVIEHALLLNKQIRDGMQKVKDAIKKQSTQTIINEINTEFRRAKLAITETKRSIQDNLNNKKKQVTMFGQRLPRFNQHHNVITLQLKTSDVNLDKPENMIGDLKKMYEEILSKTTHLLKAFNTSIQQCKGEKGGDNAVLCTTNIGAFIKNDRPTLDNVFKGSGKNKGIQLGNLHKLDLDTTKFENEHETLMSHEKPTNLKLHDAVVDSPDETKKTAQITQKKKKD